MTAPKRWSDSQPADCGVDETGCFVAVYELSAFTEWRRDAVKMGTDRSRGGPLGQALSSMGMIFLAVLVMWSGFAAGPLITWLFQVELGALNILCMMATWLAVIVALFQASSLATAPWHGTQMLRADARRVTLGERTWDRGQTRMRIEGRRLSITDAVSTTVVEGRPASLAWFVGQLVRSPLTPMGSEDELPPALRALDRRRLE